MDTEAVGIAGGPGPRQEIGARKKPKLACFVLDINYLTFISSSEMGKLWSF